MAPELLGLEEGQGEPSMMGTAHPQQADCCKSCHAWVPWKTSQVVFGLIS